MILQSCFPVGLDICTEVQHGDVIGLTTNDGEVILSVNGEVIAQHQHLLFRLDYSQPRVVPDWSESVRQLAKEVVETWQAERHAGAKLLELTERAGLPHNNDLGGLLSINGQTVYRWKQNQTLPSHTNILKFRQLFGI